MHTSYLQCFVISCVPFALQRKEAGKRARRTVEAPRRAGNHSQQEDDSAKQLSAIKEVISLQSRTPSSPTTSSCSNRVSNIYRNQPNKRDARGSSDLRSNRATYPPPPTTTSHRPTDRLQQQQPHQPISNHKYLPTQTSGSARNSCICVCMCVLAY